MACTPRHQPNEVLMAPMTPLTTTMLVTHDNSRPGSKCGNATSPTKQAPHGVPTTTTVAKQLPTPHHHIRAPSTIVHEWLRPTMHNDKRAPLHHLCLVTSGPTSRHNHNETEQWCHRMTQHDPPPSPSTLQCPSHSCRNPQESSGILRNGTGIRRNGTGIELKCSGMGQE